MTSHRKLTPVALLLLIAAAGCHPAAQEDPEAIAGRREAALAPREVSLVEPELREEQPTLELVGEIRPIDTVLIAPEVAGKLDRVLVEVGDRVRKDQPLAEVDRATFKLYLQQAEANLAAARADLDLAGKELERKNDLRSDETIPQAALDQAKTTHELAAARLTAADVARSLAERDWQRSVVRAPAAGAITARHAVAGQWTDVGQELLELAVGDQVKIAAAVPAEWAPRLAGLEGFRFTAGLRAELREARLYSVDPAVNTSSRSFEVIGLADNSDGKLRPGMFANITLVAPEPVQSLWLPSTAIAAGDLPKVMLTDGGSIVVRDVQVGRREGGLVEVLTGLEPGESVIANVSGLARGLPVTVVERSAFMNLYDTAIRRPVFTIMLMVALVVFGILGYVELPVNLLPSLDIPIVTVITLLPGASPEVVETDVTDVIENEVNTIEGIDSLVSQSLQGVSWVTITFDLERNIDIASQDVRDKVSAAVGNLPLDAEPPIVQKLDVNSSPMLWMALAGLDRRQLSDYTDQIIRPKLQSVPGVGNVFMSGFREPMMRIWIDRDKLAAFGLTVNEVIGALRQENIELPGGYIEGPKYELTVRNLGLLETPEEFNQMIIATVGGRPIRLSDVGIAQVGIADERGMGRFSLAPALGLGIAPRSGANLVEVNRGAIERMKELAEDFPEGVTWDIAFDGAEFVEVSIRNVQIDIAYGAILAIFVVFVFLRSWRSTFIVSLAIPTSLIATFGFMRVFGFSLNNLTTLALALSVGVVIDDAIVVLENIFRHQEEGEDPMTAARNGTKEIALAAMAATFAIAAVFIPVAYMRGMIGQFMFEFGISVAAAILISLFVALTLTPMLSSRMLRVTHKHGRLYEVLEGGFKKLESGYRHALDLALRHKVLTVGGATLIFVASLALVPFIGAEFAPQEDMSAFMMAIEGPAGMSLEAMDRHMQEVERIVLSQPEINSIFAAIDLEDRGQVNQGIVFTRMLKPANREAVQTEVVERLRREFAEVIEGVQVRVIEFSFYSFGGEGSGEYAALQYSIRGPDLETLDRIGRRMIERLSEEPGFVDLNTNLDLEQPQVFVEVDRERAHDLGFDAATVYDTVYTLVAGREIGSYTTSGKRYDVRIKVLPDQVNAAGDIGALLVRTPSGEMVRLDTVVSLRHGVGPIAINRSDRERSLLLTANLEGVPLNRAVETIETAFAEELPRGYRYKAAGQAEEMADAMGSLLFAMGLAVLIVYMLLASQFNSLLHPFTIMLALPPAMTGALAALLITGHTINIMSVIGIVLLFGLVTKNSILLVDLTIQKQAQGMDREAALREACPIRLRPILMTALSMIFGVLPVALAIGEGAEARAPMAVATAGGMITSTILTLFVVPCVYAWMDRFSQWVNRSKEVPAPVAATAGGSEE